MSGSLNRDTEEFCIEPGVCVHLYESKKWDLIGSLLIHQHSGYCKQQPNFFFFNKMWFWSYLFSTNRNITERSSRSLLFWLDHGRPQITGDFRMHGQVGGRTKIYALFPMEVCCKHHGNRQIYLHLRTCQCHPSSCCSLPSSGEHIEYWSTRISRVQKWFHFRVIIRNWNMVSCYCGSFCLCNFFFLFKKKTKE